MADKFTQFDYLLNAMLFAGDSPKPAELRYGEKRWELYAHVRELERKAAAYDAMRTASVAAPRPAEPTDDDLRRVVVMVPIYSDDREHAYHIRLARAVLCAHGAQASQPTQPVAWVPIHPRTGPLWAMTTDKPDAERLPGSYPLRPLVFAHGVASSQEAEWLLYEHDDGRHAVAPSAEAATFAHGDPAWHRVGPVAVHGVDAPDGSKHG